MDIAMAQQRVPCFIPLSEEHVALLPPLDRFNATTIIHPFSTFRFCWDSFIMIIIVFTMFEIPLTLSFGIDTGDIHTNYGAFVLTIDLLLCFDLLLNFRTGYFHRHDELRLISDPKRIAKQYLCGWFLVDFMTSYVIISEMEVCVVIFLYFGIRFPFEFMTPRNIDLGGAPAVLRAFRILRLVRLFKLVRFFRMLKLVNSFLREFMGPTATLILRLVRLIAFMMLAAHSAACLWYYVGYVNYDDESKGSWLRKNEVDIENVPDAYLVSLYWSIVTLFTTGYGDIIPVNRDEQMVAAAVILLGTMCFAYLIGAVGSLVAEGDRARSIRETKYEEAQAFCANKRLPPQLARAIMTHSTYFWKRNFVYDDLDILQSLPYGIQYDVLKFTGRRMFGDFAPFDMLPMTTKGLLALRLKQFSCNKGFPVYRHGDIAKELYIQRTGRSCLVIPERQKKRKMSDRKTDKTEEKTNDNANTNTNTAGDIQIESEIERNLRNSINVLNDIPTESIDAINDNEMDDPDDNPDDSNQESFEKLVSMHRQLSYIPYFETKDNVDHNQRVTPIDIDNLDLDDEDMIGRVQTFGTMRASKVLSLGDLKGKNYRLKRGDVAGHIGFVKGARSGTLYCETWSEFYSLSRRDLEEVLFMEHPDRHEDLLQQILHSLKSFKPKKAKSALKKQDGHLTVDLDTGRKRTQSKLAKLFTEDSVQRNTKILHEMIPSMDTMEGDNGMGIEMVEINHRMNGDDHGIHSASSSSESTTDGMIGTNTGQTAMVIPVTQRKGGQGAKRKRIGKQGGGGGNRGGSTAPRRPMAIPKRTQQRSASRNGDDLPNSTAAMGSRPTNETVTATVTNTNSTGKATVNSSDTEREAANREAFSNGGGYNDEFDQNHFETGSASKPMEQPVIVEDTLTTPHHPSIPIQPMSQESFQLKSANSNTHATTYTVSPSPVLTVTAYDEPPGPDLPDDVLSVETDRARNPAEHESINLASNESKVAPATRSRELAPRQVSATAVETQNERVSNASRVAKGSPRQDNGTSTNLQTNPSSSKVAIENDSGDLNVWNMASDQNASGQQSKRQRAKSKETVHSDTAASSTRPSEDHPLGQEFVE